MKYPSIPVTIASLVLASVCVRVPVTAEGLVVIMSVAGLGGALCTYLYAPRSITLEKGTLVGASVGLIGGLLGFVASVLVLWKTGNTGVIFNLRSLNLAIVGLIQLALAAGVGGLAVGLLSRVRARKAAVKEE